MLEGLYEMIVNIIEQNKDLSLIPQPYEEGIVVVDSETMQIVLITLKPAAVVVL